MNYSALEKLAQDISNGTDITSSLKNAWGWAKKNIGEPSLSWYNGLDDKYKALIHGAAAGLGGAAIGGLIGGKKGALGGSLVAGLAGTIDWSKVKQYIDYASIEAAKSRASSLVNAGANAGTAK